MARYDTGRLRLGLRWVKVPAGHAAAASGSTHASPSLHDRPPDDSVSCMPPPPPPGTMVRARLPPVNSGGVTIVLSVLYTLQGTGAGEGAFSF